MINMSAGVTSANYIYRKVVTIPQADVQIMDFNNPYTLINTANNFIVQPIALYLYIINQTIPYTGFVHLHITNNGVFGIGGILGTLSENATAAGLSNATGEYYNMLINFQTSPNRFGSQGDSKPLDIAFDTAPTAGDGDMVVTLLYLIQDLF